MFELKTLDIGKVLSITVGHGRVGRGRGWYCAGLQLRIGDNKTELLFPCDRLVVSSYCTIAISFVASIETVIEINTFSLVIYGGAMLCSTVLSL